MLRFPLLSVVLWVVALAVAEPGARASEDTLPAELSRFGALARTELRKPISETPSAPLAEAMDILVHASDRILARAPDLSDEKLMARLAPFKQRMNPEKRDVGVMEPTWFEVNTARHGGRCAIAVTMGAVSRLAVFDRSGGGSYEVGAPMRWLYRYHQRPQFAANGLLLVISDSVQDAGMREGLRIDLLGLSGRRFTVRQTLKRLFVLDKEWPARVSRAGDRLTLESVDAPGAILTSHADTHFERVETFAIEPAGLRPLSVLLRDPELRAVDAWLQAAKEAKRPAPMQSLARHLVPEGAMLSDCTVRALGAGQVAATVTFEDANVRFTLQKTGGSLRVIAVQSVRK